MNYVYVATEYVGNINEENHVNVYSSMDDAINAIFAYLLKDYSETVIINSMDHGSGDPADGYFIFDMPETDFLCATHYEIWRHKVDARFGY